jgi:galactokinase
VTQTVHYSAPGRVNLIGDHTDYTGGLVMPMTIDAFTTVIGQANTSRFWNLVSHDEPDSLSIDLPIEDPSSMQPRWGRYVAGVLFELKQLGIEVPGFTGEISTTIPIGSGLSSSAALEIAIARTALSIADVVLTDTDIALLCQRAEHIASGVPCGIMDQLCIAVGQPNTATLIDCHTLDVQHIVMPDEIEVVTRFISQRTLAGSEYSDRVTDCVNIEKLIGPLRLASIGDAKNINDQRLYRRARHVITENQRVRDFSSALSQKDFSTAGELMLASHESLTNDYETSNPTMDQAVKTMMSEPGFLGARITGGGFGGCIVGIRHSLSSTIQ